MKENRTAEEKLYESILKLRTLEECERFFEDICTPAEFHALAQRHEVATLLLEKKVYTEIMEKTSASTATISRVKRMLNQGTGCLAEIIQREDQEV